MRHPLNRKMNKSSGRSKRGRVPSLPACLPAIVLLIQPPNVAREKEGPSINCVKMGFFSGSGLDVRVASLAGPMRDNDTITITGAHNGSHARIKVDNRAGGEGPEPTRAVC